MFKKIGKSMVVVLLMLVMLCEPCVIHAQTSTPTVSLPSSDNAKIIGFTTRRTMAVYYNCSQPLLDPDIARTQIVGYCYTYIGRYRAKEKVDGKYYDALLIKSCMTPNIFYDKKGNKRYGYSQYLQYSMTLDSKCEYQYNTPVNSTSGYTAYSVGIMGGKGSASVSASISCNSKYCEVIDMSRQDKNQFKVAFDYCPSLVDWSSSSERNKNVLFAQTWQMATCEWTTSASSYNVWLDVYAKFGTSKSKNGGGMYMPLGNYSSGKSTSYSCSIYN